MTLKSTAALTFSAILAGAGGIMVYQYLGESLSNAPNHLSNLSLQKSSITISDIKQQARPIRPEFTLKDLDDKNRNINEWDGKLIILNFWATWCPPCKKEMPAFIQLQKKYRQQGLQIIGIAIDQKALVKKFTESIGVNYPILYGELNAIDIGRNYGNQRGQLPYTVFINKQKQVVGVKRGELSKEEAENAIKALLK